MTYWNNGDLPCEYELMLHDYIKKFFEGSVFELDRMGMFAENYMLNLFGIAR